MKNSFLSMIVAAIAAFAASDATGQVRPPEARITTSKSLRALGRVKVVYRMYGSQKKLVNSRPLASSYASYLTKLGAQTRLVRLGSRYMVTWSMRGSRTRTFTTRRSAVYFQNRLRTLGFHVTILGK